MTYTNEQIEDFRNEFEAAMAERRFPTIGEDEARAVVAHGLGFIAGAQAYLEQFAPAEHTLDEWSLPTGPSWA